MVRALRRVSDVAGVGLGGVDVSAVPHRRVVALARYAMAAKATALRRHSEPRRVATLGATVRSLETKAVDDALELFDVLMTNDLLARAARESRNEKLRRYPRLSKDAGKLAAAVGVLLDALDNEQQLSLDLVWESKVSRTELRAAVAHLLELAPRSMAIPTSAFTSSTAPRPPPPTPCAEGPASSRRRGRGCPKGPAPPERAMRFAWLASSGGTATALGQRR